MILWVGAFLLLIIMSYNWMAPQNPRSALRAKNIFIDQLLLSTRDLEMSENANLIKITLGKEGQSSNQFVQDSVVNTPPNRKLVYSKILNNQIKKISSKSKGFTIKPLPQ